MARWRIELRGSAARHRLEREVRNGRGQGSAALADLMDLGAEICAGLEVGGAAGPGAPGWVVGRVEPLEGPTLRESVAEIERARPLELRSPFEGCREIAGEAWRGREHLDPARTDGLALLRFDERAIDLVAHAHLESARAVIVLEGRGVFHASEEGLEEFTGARMRCIDLEAGDLLAFSRGLVHTFSAPSSGLWLLSYHATFVEFDDARQYTPTAKRWWPHPAP